MSVFVNSHRNKEDCLVADKVIGICQDYSPGGEIKMKIKPRCGIKEESDRGEQTVKEVLRKIRLSGLVPHIEEGDYIRGSEIAVRSGSIEEVQKTSQRTHQDKGQKLEIDGNPCPAIAYIDAKSFMDSNARYDHSVSIPNSFRELEDKTLAVKISLDKGGHASAIIDKYVQNKEEEWGDNYIAKFSIPEDKVEEIKEELSEIDSEVEFREVERPN